MSLQKSSLVFCLISSFINVCNAASCYSSSLGIYYTCYSSYSNYNNNNYYNYYNYKTYYGLNTLTSVYYLTGGTIAGIAIGVIVFIGVVISLIVACCIKANSSGGRATRGTVVQPTQPTLAMTTTSASPAYPNNQMQPPPIYMGNQGQGTVGYPAYPANVPIVNSSNLK